MIDIIEVLDKGYVNTVDCLGNDNSIVRSARVSYGKENTKFDLEKDSKLINYLWKNKHTSPFESAVITFEVKAPIFVFRQWHRHRTQSYNEVSARYTELPEEYYIPAIEVIGEQSKFNKQARELNRPLDDPYLLLKGSELDSYKKLCNKAFGFYSEMLLAGWPRELARMVLPLSTYSRMYATANLLNWFRFLTLRTHKHAQWEIQQYANAIVKLLRQYFPISVAAWEEFK